MQLLTTKAILWYKAKAYNYERFRPKLCQSIDETVKFIFKNNCAVATISNAVTSNTINTNMQNISVICLAIEHDAHPRQFDKT